MKEDIKILKESRRRNIMFLSAVDKSEFELRANIIKCIKYIEKLLNDLQYHR